MAITKIEETIVKEEGEAILMTAGYSWANCGTAIRR